MASPRNGCLARCLAMSFLILLLSFADAASFQYNQVPQPDQDYRVKSIQRLPSPDMLKALEYIENLRKQASRTESVPDYPSYQSAPFLSEQKDAGVQTLPQDSAKSPTIDDESEWMRAMLEALMQAEKEAKLSPQEKSKQYSSMDKSIPAELIEDYESNKWPEKRPKSGRFPGRYYEDYSRDSPLKRTNEIVEGQYTPQNLATLQSVFQELGKLKGQTNHKRDRLEDDQKLYKDDEDDIYKANNIAYEDVAGGEDWNPIEEKVESQTQEEMKESKEELEKTDEMEEEMKRSGLLGLQEDDSEKDNKEQESENLSNLMNYYLKVLMNKMDKGKPNAEKRSTKHLGKDLDPDAIYQLIDISRNLQIPPEDLIDMLQDDDGRKFGGRLESEKEVEVPDDLDEISETTVGKVDVIKNKQGFVKQPSTVILPNVPEDLTVEDMMNMLGAEKLSNKKPSFLNQLSQKSGLSRSYPMLSRAKGRKTSWLNDFEKRQMEYEPRSDKEEDLAEYMVKMLAKYPELLENNQNKRYSLLYPPGDEMEPPPRHRGAYVVNPRILKELKVLSKDNRRLLSTRESDDTQSKQYPDEDMLMKVLEYLNQEKADKGRDHIVKRSMENM